MTATITKIHPLKSGKTMNTSFIRVEFEGMDGKWYKTDLCPNFRNYRNWVRWLKVGQTLSALKVDGSQINADSRPVFMPSLDFRNRTENVKQQELL